MLPGEPPLSLVDLFPPRPAWMAEAACRGRGPDVFFPSRGGPTEEIRELCGRCRVKDPCLAFALAEDLEGVWAGTSKRERRAMRRRGRNVVTGSP
jgi:WhiB family redox-sensing transcriptional regulator